jgi:hypothetical protein
MKYIEPAGKVIAEWALTWHSSTGTHIDKLWADPVNLWRDVLPQDLVKELLGREVGALAVVDIPARDFPTPYDQHQILRIRPEQFLAQGGLVNGLPPWPGRMYPRRLFKGVFNVPSANGRYLGREGKGWLFDFNQPLAGYDLRLTIEIKGLYPRHTERGGRCLDWLEEVSGDGPGMQVRYGTGPFFLGETACFQRRNEEPDALFYRQPRLVQHLDRVARKEIRHQYGQLLKSGDRVLDLMASWTSHLPDNLDLAGLTVLGLNEDELRHNKEAEDKVVHDLNREPRLPFGDQSFDAVICTASVEYLIQPQAVVAEIQRILRPGGLLAFAFSNRWFPPKVIRVWPDLHEFERMGLVAELFHAVGGFTGVTTLSRRGLPRPADDPHSELFFSDPVYMVWGYRS